MKKILCLLLTISIVCLVISCTNSSTKRETSGVIIDLSGIVYTCANHPEIVSNQPGKCPKCGMELERVNKASDSTAQ